MFVGLREKARPNWLFAGRTATGATMVANGLGKYAVSGMFWLRTDIGNVMAAAVVAATLGATNLAPTNMLMRSSKMFMVYPYADADGPPCNMELEVACPPNPINGSPSIARTRVTKLGSPNLA